MYNNCTPCRCRKMFVFIEKIAEKVCERKCEELIKDKLPGLVEEEVKKYIKSSSLKGIHAQLYGTKNVKTEIAKNGIVPFKIVISDLSDITLSNGEFSIPKDGNYLINWTIAAPFGHDDWYKDFSIAVNGIPKAQAGSMMSYGPIDSAAVIELKAGDIVTLKNISGQDVYLETVPDTARPTAINFQANIVISYID